MKKKNYQYILNNFLILYLTTFLYDEIGQKFFHIHNQHGRLNRKRCIYVNYYYIIKIWILAPSRT